MPVLKAARSPAAPYKLISAHVLLSTLLVIFTPNTYAQFGGENIINKKCSACDVESISASDIDGDGYRDVISASSQDNKVAWYRNNEGNGYGPQNVITGSATNVRSAHGADLDGDGDQDVLTAPEGKINWYENAGSGEFKSPELITPNVEDPLSVQAADLDGDDDQDVIVVTRDQVAWHENNGEGTFSAARVITTVPNPEEAVNNPSVSIADIDGDGSQDVLYRDVLTISWYDNNGDGGFDDGRTISSYNYSKSAHVGDLDGDGDLDIAITHIFSPKDKETVWIENKGGGSFSARNIIDDTYGGSSIRIADTDNDDSSDVLLGGEKLYRYENIGGDFTSREAISSESAELLNIDQINNGPYSDIVAASGDNISWYENDGGTFKDARMVNSPPDLSKPNTVTTADLNGDGNQDVIVGANKLVSYINEGEGRFSPQHTISDQKTVTIATADLDGDSDLDVVAGSFESGKIAWYENEGSGEFSSPNVVLESKDGVVSVHTVDVNNDGIKDILASFKYDLFSSNLRLSWMENNKGELGFENKIMEDVIAFDTGNLDGDNDGADIVAGVDTDSFTGLAWRENNEGSFSDNVQLNQTYDIAKNSVQAYDLGGDGDSDIFFAEDNPTRDEHVSFHRNKGSNVFGAEETIVNSFNATYFIFAENVKYKNKGSSLVLAHHDKVTWKNITNEGGGIVTNNIDVPIRGNGQVYDYIHLSDIDNDSDDDILYASSQDDEVGWVKKEYAGGSAKHCYFAVSGKSYRGPSNWDTISNYRVADWSELEKYSEQVGGLPSLLDGLGLTKFSDQSYLYRNGQKEHSKHKYYFLSRHNGNKPTGFTAHDQIGNNIVSLGSSDGIRKVMMINPNLNFIEDSQFHTVNEKPELIGGLSALQEAAEYPEFAERAGIEGRVYVSLIVNQYGDVECPAIDKGVHKLLDEEAIEAIKEMEFIPATKNGKKVRTKTTLPVTFRLDGSVSPQIKWPVDDPRITQDYGAHGVVIENEYHTGIDITSATSKPSETHVYPSDRSKVVLYRDNCEPNTSNRCNNGWGNFVVLESDVRNFFTLYAHLASVSSGVENGVDVSPNSVLGTMGATGGDYAKHLHFGLLSNEPSSVADLGEGYSSVYPSEMENSHRDPRRYMKHVPISIQAQEVEARECFFSVGSCAPSDVVATLSKGEKYVSVARTADGEKHLIYLPSKKRSSTAHYGWVSSDEVEVDPRLTYPYVEIDGVALEDAPLNVREAPESSSTPLTKVWGGQRFVTSGSPVDKPGSRYKWYPIHIPTSTGKTEGWVAGDFVSVVNPTTKDLQAKVTKYVDSGGRIDFDEAGVDLVLSDFAGSGNITIKKFGKPPDDDRGIPQSNVSKYRFVFDTSGDFRFNSDTEIHMDVDSLGGVGDPNQVTIYRRSPPGLGSFTALTTKYDDESNELVATTGVLGEFTLASNTEPLPVELTRFEAAVKGEEVLLEWRTASETNNSGFYVQRRASETDSWTRLAFVEGKGTTSSPQTYRYRDADMPYAADPLTYRLKQVDTGGSTSRSEPIKVRRGAPGELKLFSTFPNPARQQTTLRYAVPERQDITIHLYDMLGRKVKTVVNGEREGRKERQLDVSRLASGVYFLRLKSESATKTQRLTVVR